MQTIFRIARNRENPYCVVPNALAQNSKLTFEARGLLLYLLSKPDDWMVRMADLQKAAFHTGREKVQRIVRDLLAAGYMERKVSHDEHGRIVTETLVYEVPVSVPTVDGSTADGKAVDGGTVDGEAVCLLSTDSPSTDLQSTEIQKKNGANAPARKRASRPPAESDPRSQHPAVQLARGVAGKYPPKELWDDVIAILDVLPDENRLVACRKEWVSRGYNMNSWRWLTEWYVKGITPPGGSTGGGPPKRETAYERSGKVLEKYIGGANGDRASDWTGVGVVAGELAEPRDHRADHPALPSGPSGRT